MDILIIGGTRNLGHMLVLKLVEAGHAVTILNRGLTRDELPDYIERLRADRTDPDQLQAVLQARSFDAVVDSALYKGDEAEALVNLLAGRVGHYIFLSTGQVYLVREGLKRPFREEDYDGPLIPEPSQNTYDHEEWNYGVQKRDAEAVLRRAWEMQHFPYTSLRLPMVNSERDHFRRFYSYMLRLKDGGPILVPATPDHPLRHVYGADVVNAILLLIERRLGKGQPYNLAQDETLPLEDFLALVGDIMGIAPQVIKVERSLLEANGFLPDCSPFSDIWMSELDNCRSKEELGIRYTPLRTYLEKLVNHYENHPPQKPASYRRRHAEKNFVLQNI